MSNGSLSTDKEYGEILAQIKATDEISFKVLGFVPLGSGATVLGLIHGDELARGPMVFAICGFAVLVVVGFFRWELRNVQTCSWLYGRATAIDGQPRPKPPGNIGKFEAECLIYSSTVLLWIALPWLFLVGGRLVDPTTVVLAIAHALASIVAVVLAVHGVVSTGRSLRRGKALAAVGG